METLTQQAVLCSHCGQVCDELIQSHNLAFCCVGCQSVYEILHENNLCTYYELEKNSGVSQKNVTPGSFDYLDEETIRRKVISFDSAELSKVTLYVPAIHCVSCIWLLENLRKLNPAVLRTEVEFAKKSISVDFDPQKIKLSEVAQLISSLGYAPLINLEASQEKKRLIDKTLLYKLAVAGFCFGNVMLFSFPEYLGIDRHEADLMRLFSILNIALSIPVFFYSASDYFTSALQAFRQKQINIDVPIAAGLIALFARSVYDIVTATGPGYLDSFAGLVFFLLIGRWFQSKTYESLAFDRDFKSYFPLAVSRRMGDQWKPVIIYELQQHDTIRIRNMEIVPADSTLITDHAYFDYSFVTGESRPSRIKKGDIVFAGGRLIGAPVELIVEKKTSQSHLTSLWNKDSYRKVNESHYQKIIDRAARRFTWIVIGLAAATAVFWYYYQPAEMWLVLTSVLMVACPCALALAAPFTYGSMLRAFGRHDFYLKNADVIERLATIDAVVFDKTGTITFGKVPDVTFNGDLSPSELLAVKLLASTSTHALSNLIAKSITGKPTGDLVTYKELPGKGLQAIIDNHYFQVGSAAFVGAQSNEDPKTSVVYVSIDGQIRGYFSIHVKIRKHMKVMLKRLGKTCMAMLSGDNEADRSRMATLFGPSVQLHFNQDPHQKLAFIKELQASGRKVLMIGDGLNDSGALQQSDIGIAVTDDTGVFTPACDGILSGSKLEHLDRFVALAKSSSTILKIAFGISFMYNAIALSIAATGHLTPLVAAILMPVSSISVVGFATLAVNYITTKKLVS